MLLSSMCLFTLLFILNVISAQFWPPTPCDALVEEYCSYPFPNDYWLIKDSNMNPVHLNVSVINMPIDIHGVTMNPHDWNQLNGFSPLSAILIYFENVSLENSNVARLWNISQSQNEDSPIIILDASTNERIDHWVELDHNSDDKNGYEAMRTLMVWPAKRLNDGQRYIVAMRNLMNNDNKLINASTAFIALRDNITTNNSAIEQRREYYNKYIFPYLSANHISIDYTLQISWDFTVMSTDQMTQRMITIRDDAFSRINWTDGGIKYRITEITDNFDENIARRIAGFMTVPWYLNQRGPGQNVRLITKENDFLTPVYQSDDEIYFELLVPYSVANGSRNALNLQFGHGLFGSIQEILSQTSFWNKWGFVVGGVNWLGMMDEDAAPIGEMLATNLTNMPMIPDRLHQGMLNALLYTKLFNSTDFLNNKLLFYFQEYNHNIFNNETPQTFYWGISLGGILGSVYMSISTDVTYGTCNVPGFPFEMLLPRSIDFNAYHETLETRYNTSFDIDFVYSGAQLLWNRLSPSGYINHLTGRGTAGSLPNTPNHNVLLQYSLGDHQVTWLGAQQIGRTINASMYESNYAEYNETLFSYNWINDNVVINTTDYAINGGYAMISGWNYNQPQVPFTNVPPNQGSDTHDFTFQQDDAQKASYIFYTKGIIYNMCNGPCNGTIP